MARTGTFGRRPRSSQSLTNTLIAIAREFQRQREENIMSAWQKGGTFEGGKATDERVMKFWNERLSGISKDDPLHDTYKNAVLQIDYSIHESKMTAAYATGKTGDAAMVNFYLGWAKKVPKNSEFYRVLQRDAGQYMRNQRAVSDADKRAAEEARYQKLQNATKDGKEAAGDFMIETLRRVAQSGYADGGLAAVISGPGSGSDFTDFDPQDPEQMMKLLGVITSEDRGVVDPGEPGGARKPTTESVGNPDVIYHDDDGNPVTGASIVEQLGKLDPTWEPGTPIDTSYVTDLLDRQVAGLQERIDRATKTGHYTDAESLGKSKAYVAMLNREVGAWPIQKSYTDMRETFDAVANDPNASPQAVLNAFRDYQSGLVSLSKDPAIAADDAMRSRLIGEANGDAGVPTLFESFTGLSQSGFDAGSATDSANTAAHMEFLQGQLDAVAESAALPDGTPGKVSWTYGSTNSSGVFVPGAGGTEIGAAPVEAIDAGGQNMQSVTVADPRGGVPIKLYVTATPVFAAATDPTTGEALQAENGKPVAYAYDLPQGGALSTVYGFQTTDGFVFSANPPWGDSNKVTASSKGGNHLEVTITPPTVTDMTQQDQGNGWHIQGRKVNERTGEVTNPGVLTFDPQGAVYATSDRNATGGADPNSDFASLTLASMMYTPDGQTVLSNLDKNPAFRSQLDDDAARYAGMQRDPATGAWVPGTGDPAKLAQAQGQNSMAGAAKTFRDMLGITMGLWQRATTGSPFPGAAPATQPGQTGSAAPFDMGSVNKLATDLLKGTPFEALGNIFQTGTNSIKQPEADTGDAGMRINPVGTIKVPQWVPPKITQMEPTTVAGPYAAPTQTQQGTTAPTQTQQQTGQTAPHGPAHRPS